MRAAVEPGGRGWVISPDELRKVRNDAGRGTGAPTFGRTDARPRGVPRTGSERTTRRVRRRPFNKYAYIRERISQPFAALSFNRLVYAYVYIRRRRRHRRRRLPRNSIPNFPPAVLRFYPGRSTGVNKITRFKTFVSP